MITISTPNYEIVTVNGKDYVIFYPQFLKDGDWATVGNENPLPINIIELDTLKNLTESLRETSEQNKEKLEQLNELISEMSMLSRGPKGDKGDPGPPNLEAQKDIDEHKQDKNNPHEVTKSQIGLGNVQNYGIALESQAKAGVSNATYMTPLRTKQAIDHQRPVLIDRKKADVAGTEYPEGISFMDIEGNGVSDGYPQHYGTVVTYKSANNRMSQEFIGNGFNENQEDKWMRHYHPNNANNGWTEWVKILTEKDASGVKEIVRGENFTNVKYSDGRMEEFFRLNLGSTTLGGSHGSGPPRTGAKNHVFFSEFAHTPCVVISHEVDDASYTLRGSIPFYRKAQKDMLWYIQVINPFDAETDEDFIIHGHAFGFWK